jgi:hypothetical protein
MVCVNKNSINSERKCAISVSDLRVRQNKFEKNTQCKSEMLDFFGIVLGLSMMFVSFFQ